MKPGCQASRCARRRLRRRVLRVARYDAEDCHPPGPRARRNERGGRQALHTGLSQILGMNSPALGDPFSWTVAPPGARMLSASSAGALCAGRATRGAGEHGWCREIATDLVVGSVHVRIGFGGELDRDFAEATGRTNKLRCVDATGFAPTLRAAVAAIRRLPQPAAGSATGTAPRGRRP